MAGRAFKEFRTLGTCLVAEGYDVAAGSVIHLCAHFEEPDRIRDDQTVAHCAELDTTGLVRVEVDHTEVDPDTTIPLLIDARSAHLAILPTEPKWCRLRAIAAGRPARLDGVPARLGWREGPDERRTRAGPGG